jgi:dTDP-3-amino-3,4,6-trideoxy-alpha-D-glucose transaminase
VPAAPAHGDHVYHLFVVRTPHRDALREHLTARGVASAIHYPTAVHASEAFAPYAPAGGLPVAERLSRESLSLPLWPHMTDGDVERVVEAVRTFRSEAGPAAGEEVPAQDSRS